VSLALSPASVTVSLALSPASVTVSLALSPAPSTLSLAPLAFSFSLSAKRSLLYIGQYDINTRTYLEFPIAYS
jgi:hypothetical protein